MSGMSVPPPSCVTLGGADFLLQGSQIHDGELNKVLELTISVPTLCSSIKVWCPQPTSQQVRLVLVRSVAHSGCGQSNA